MLARAQNDVTQAGVRADASVVSAEIVARELAADPTVGLSVAEAARRLATDGFNELRMTKPVPVWRKILVQFEDPLIYLLLFAVVTSILAWGVDGATGVPVDALVISVIVLLNALIG